MRRVFSAEDFGKEVRMKRKKLGYTQKELSDGCGVGVRFISDLENGKPTVELEKVIQVVHMLGMNIYVEDR